MNMIESLQPGERPKYVTGHNPNRGQHPTAVSQVMNESQLAIAIFQGENSFRRTFSRLNK